MKSTIFVLGIGLVLLFTRGCNKLRSRDRINNGIQSYKGARYADAVEFFKEAVQLDPSNVNGRLYLATAYMSQYIPGAESPDNMQLAKEAKEEFNKVLENHPNDTTALASLASLSYQQAQGMPDLDQKLKKLDEAKEWYLKLIAADPQNKEGFYSLAVIDWVKWYAAWMKARADLGMKPEEPGPLKDKKVKAELNEKYAAVVDDGMKNLREGARDRQGLRRRHGVHEPADPREGRSGRHARTVQGRRGKSRHLGPKGARDQEDESAEGSRESCRRHHYRIEVRHERS